MMQTLDPELLQAFVQVAEQRSFTRAAGTLNRTQSAISMQVRRLEDRLGVALLHRSRSGVVLSGAGESLIGYARRILALNEEAIGRMQENRIDGTVRLGVMEDYGTQVVPPLLASFLGGHPRVKVEMETGLTSPMLEHLGDRFDLLIAMHPRDHGDGELLRHEQAVWAAAPDRPVAGLDPLPIALYPQGCLFRQWAMEALDRSQRRWRLGFVCQSQAAVEAIVAQGLAVTVVKHGLFSPALRRATVDDRLPALPAAAIRLHRAHGLPPAAALLADHLAAALRGSG